MILYIYVIKTNLINFDKQNSIPYNKTRIFCSFLFFFIYFYLFCFRDIWDLRPAFQNWPLEVLQKVKIFICQIVLILIWCDITCWYSILYFYLILCNILLYDDIENICVISLLFCIALYNTIQYNTIQYNIIQYNTIQDNTRQ